MKRNFGMNFSKKKKRKKKKERKKERNVTQKPGSHISLLLLP